MRDVTLVLVLVAACSDSPPDPQSCAGYVHPAPPPATGCGDPSDPMTLVACDLGDADVGGWAIDGEGLPAFDLRVDERCDEAAHAWSPSPVPLRDPIHVIGDGFGTVAMAHASGGIDLYMQDRGHAWPIHVDTWRDEQDASFAPQLGAAIGYVVDGTAVHSTRFEDLPVASALAAQTRRFGVGYVETVTTLDGLVVTRRVFAPAGARALVTEVTIDNIAGRDRTLGLVELDDANLYELAVELATSDLLAPSVTADITRRRRGRDALFTQHASYDAGARVAALVTTAKQPQPDAPSDVDYAPATLWLAALDDEPPDAAWLADGELWDGIDRTPPRRAAAAGDATSRAVDLDGAGQPGVLALRVPVIVPAGSTVTRRFAVGVVPQGQDPIAAADHVRALQPDGHAAAVAWKPRLVWAAVPGQPDAGALQREVAWSSYVAQAVATYDAYYQMRLLGQGGSYKYIHGIDGAIGDYTLFADAVALIDPALAADTLALSLATQRAPALPDAGRYPYATTGVGDFTDVVRYDRRSDAYFLLPAQIARYVALARDRGFLDRSVPYWPRSAGQGGSVLDHLRATQRFADTTLGFGAHGLVAMGTNDYADGVLQTATEPATPEGTSSTFNAWLLVLGYSLAADVVAPRDATLAARYTAERADQLAKLDQFAWNGRWYERGFVDSGNPLGKANLYLEPQILPIIAGAIAPERRAALLALVHDHMDTPIGPMTVIPLDASGSTGGIDQPQVGGVWPVASAWLTEAYALADPARGWDSLVRNTLFRHAAAFPHLWYGVWSGPDSYDGPDAERPGEADAHLATALTDYPVLNTHAHVSVLRALQALAGIQPRATGIELAPMLPTETFSIIWPRLALASTPTTIGGSLTAVGDDSVVLRVRLPSGLRSGALVLAIDGVAAQVTRDGDSAVFTLPVRAGVAATWAISSLR